MVELGGLNIFSVIKLNMFLSLALSLSNHNGSLTLCSIITTNASASLSFVLFATSRKNTVMGS